MTNTNSADADRCEMCRDTGQVDEYDHCHSPIPCPRCKPKEKKTGEERGWEEEFDEKFPNLLRVQSKEFPEWNGSDNPNADLKSFITKAEQQALERGGAAVVDAVDKYQKETNVSGSADEIINVVHQAFNSLKN